MVHTQRKNKNFFVLSLGYLLQLTANSTQLDVISNGCSKLTFFYFSQGNTDSTELPGKLSHMSCTFSSKIDVDFQIVHKSSLINTF